MNLLSAYFELGNITYVLNIISLKPQLYVL